MKTKLATTLMVLASQLFITPVFAICIWNFGNTCAKQDITNTATNKVTATVKSGADAKAEVKIGETTQITNADIIKQFIGSQDSTQLFIPLTAAATKQTENTTQIFKEFQNTIKDINKSNQELLTKQAEENRKFTEQIIKQVIGSPPTIPIVSGSSSFPIILPTNSVTTPIYINEVNQQLTNTLNNLNTTLSNMSIPIAGGTVTNIPNGPGSTLAPVAIADLPTGGNIGTAATTVDINSAFVITQTTASQTITLPSPTLPTGSRLVTVQSGSGSTNSFTIYGETLSAGQAVDLLWNGTAWINASGGDPTTQNLTYGRVNASTDLASTVYTSANNGVKIPFNNFKYASGITMTGTDVMTPSVTGRYRVSWLMQAGSGEFAGNGYFVVMQNGVFVDRVLYDMMEAAGVNQCSGFIDVDLTAGLPVELRYQSVPATDTIVWQVGSYFQIDQLPTAVAPVVNTVAEYGENIGITNNQAMPSGSPTDVAGSAFTLPSAGVWAVRYDVSIAPSSGSNNNFIGLYTAANVLVPNSVGGTTGTGVGTVPNNVGHTITITTTGSATYKLKEGGPSTAIIYNNDTLGSSGGRSKITWNKIAGQLPSTGTTVDYVNVNRTTNQSVATLSPILFDNVISGNIPYNSATGIFTLSVGKTYMLKGNVAISQTAELMTTEWFNVTTSSSLAPGGYTTAGNYGGISGSNQSEVIFTPTVTTEVTLRNVTGAARTIVGNTIGAGAASSQASIVQLGSSNVIAGLYPGTWGTYTPTITAVTTNPTKPTSGIVIDTASYIVEGKKLTVNYNFWIGTAVGVNAGSGTYKFSLPAGYTIDTSKVSSIASFDPTLANPNIANAVGTAIINRGSQSALTSRFSGFVYAADTNNVAASFIQTAPSTHVMFDSSAGNAALQSGIGWTMQFTVPIN